MEDMLLHKLQEIKLECNNHECDECMMMQQFTDEHGSPTIYRREEAQDDREDATIHEKDKSTKISLASEEGKIRQSTCETG